MQVAHACVKRAVRARCTCYDGIDLDTSYRMLKHSLILIATLSAVACTEIPPPQPRATPASAQAPDELRTSDAAKRAFRTVTERVEPVAEAVCRRQTSDVNCDFRIVVDRTRGAPPNAFQTLDENERPVIVFTEALLESARNIDELAFVMGHEAAHHIEGHLARQRQNAAIGAVIFAGLATQSGAAPGDVQRAAETGAVVGARSYSKDFELEADALGTRITARSGFNPVRGAEFFNRIPDPGDRFLGTHPPNAQRLATVRRVASGL